MPCPEIRRRQYDVWLLVVRHSGEPAAECFRLLLAELRQRNVDVSDVEVDFSLAGKERRFARHIAGRLAMPDDVKDIRPDLIVRHGPQPIKECTLCTPPAKRYSRGLYR